MLKSKSSRKLGAKDVENNIVVDNRKSPKRGREKQSKIVEDKVPQKRPSALKKYVDRIRIFVGKFGWTVAKINSKSASRVLGELGKVTRIKVLSQEESCLAIAFKSKHFCQIIAILQNLCYDYKIIKIIGVVPSFFRTVS